MQYPAEEFTHFDQYFTLGEVLGEGVFGAVHTGLHNATKRKLAFKVLASNVSRGNFNHEATVLRGLRLKYTAEVYGHFILQTPEGPRAAICMEFVEGMTLDKAMELILKRPDAGVMTLHLMHEVARGIRELHEHHIVHRDLKEENVMVDPTFQHIKIIDLGLSCRQGVSNYEERRTMSPCGSVAYVRPEIMDNNNISFELMLKSDVWAFAVMFFYCFYSKFPFRGETPFSYNRNSKLNRRTQLCEVLVPGPFQACYIIIEAVLQKRVDCMGTLELLF